MNWLRSTGRDRRWMIVAAFVLLLRLPFLNQAIQGDDIYYLYGAQHAQIDPAHPHQARYAFQGEMVDMRGHPHPPLNAWILAGLLAAFGDVYEAPFHSVYILFSMIAALAMWALAKRFCERPLIATLLFLVTPAFVVNGTSLEADLPFVAFWMAGMALFVWDKYLLAAVALGLAAMTAYQAIVSAPILLVYVWLHRRADRRAWAAALTAPAVVMLWQVFERASSGALPVTVLAGYFSTYGLQQIANKLRNAAALTSHAGWIVFPALAWVAFRQRWAFAVAAAIAGFFIDPNPLFWLSFATGVLVIACHVRKPGFLTAWVAIFFASALILFFAGSARYLLPIAAPVAILAAPRGGWAIAPQLVISLALAFVNYQHWDAYRQFARAHATTDRTWVNAEWGLRFYAESDGALPLMRGQAVRPGDYVISSQLSNPVEMTTGGGQLTTIDERIVHPSLPLRLIGLNTKSGYSTASHGFRPFDITNAPLDRIRIAKAIARQPVLSFLPMNAPEADQQIVSGMYEPEGAWRWMGERALVLLKPPPQPAPLEVTMFVPDVAPARMVRVEVDGKIVAEERLAKPGAVNIKTTPVTGSNVTISVDRTFSPPGDHRKLGAIVSAVGFR